MTEFMPPRLIRGPLLQSFLANIGPRRNYVVSNAATMLAESQDEIVDCGDDVRLLLHHTPPRTPGRRQVVILIHGWEGSANSTYLLSAATRLWRAGYRIVRLNLRDHGDSHHLNQGMFHSCRLAEVVGALQRVQEMYPKEDISLVGFSLGGNFSLRIAAVAVPEMLNIRHVVAICPVLDPRQTMIALDSGWLGYRYYFIRKWRISLEKKKSVFPDVYDFTNLSRFTTLRSMTDYFVQRYTEFPDLETYLNGYALTGGRLAQLTVPATVLVADDDPVIPVADALRVADTRSLFVEHSEYGGHCGFLPGFGFDSWLDEYIFRSLGPDEHSEVTV